MEITTATGTIKTNKFVIITDKAGYDKLYNSDITPPSFGPIITINDTDFRLICIDADLSDISKYVKMNNPKEILTQTKIRSTNCIMFEDFKEKFVDNYVMFSYPRRPTSTYHNRISTIRIKKKPAAINSAWINNLIDNNIGRIITVNNDLYDGTNFCEIVSIEFDDLGYSNRDALANKSEYKKGLITRDTVILPMDEDDNHIAMRKTIRALKDRIDSISSYTLVIAGLQFIVTIILIIIAKII